MSQSSLLIVEDDAFKIERIQACLAKASQPPRVCLANSVQASVAAIANGAFDAILLDMSLPSHDVRPGGAPASSLLSGGLEVIMELAFLKRPEKVVVITQYPEVEIDGVLVPVLRADHAIREMCDISLLGVIQYKHEEQAWEALLLNLLGL